MIYTFVCRSCDREFDVDAPMAEQQKHPQCPACFRHNTMQILAGSGGFSLRGGGWASDGYTKPKARAR